MRVATTWKLVKASVAGTSHSRDDRPCQDYGLAVVLESGGGLLIAAVSDGAGSAEHSEIGAKLACETLIDRCADAFGGDTPPAEAVSRELVLSWCKDARDAIRDRADRLGTTPRELACTILVAVVADTWAAFAQIGDGAIVRTEPDGECRLVFWPQSGEYANTTTFLTDDEFAEKLQFARFDGATDAVAMLSDGLQMLALDYARRDVHAPFFRPMLTRLRESDMPSDLEGQLRDFLGSDRVNERTDDDKTLLLAVRIPPESSDEPNPGDEPR